MKGGSGQSSESAAEGPRDGGGAVRPKRRRSLRRLIAFSAIATVIGLCVVEGGLAVVGVVPASLDDPFVGFAGYSRLFEPGVDRDGTAVLKTSRPKLDWFNDQSFPADKPVGTYRIFTLGGSTTVGRPYDDATSFSRWLRVLTSEFADGDPDVEVINAGGISYASYRVARVMQELVHYDPDLFIVYTGHNEFLERHTYGELMETPEAIRGLASLMSRSRIYSVAQRVVRGSEASRDRSSSGKDVLPGEVEAILDRTVGPDSYHRDDVFRGQVETHFRDALSRMVAIARRAGARVIFVEPGANLRDCSPFKSEHRDDLTSAELNAWNGHVRVGQECMRTEQWADAVAAFRNALTIDDRFAELHYRAGQALWQMGRYAEARDSFERALAEDVCPLRAIPSIRSAVRDVAAEEGVPIVLFGSSLDAIAEQGIPGADFFLDHVHPTIGGHQLLAVQLFEELAEQGVLTIKESYSAEAQERRFAEVESTIDQRDHAVALRNLAKVLTWAGKVDDSDRLALMAADGLADDAEAQFLAGNVYIRQGKHELAIEQFRKALRLNPGHAQAHNNLGNEYFVLGDLMQAEVHFAKALEFDPTLVDGHHNLGVIALERGDHATAERHVLRALEVDPYSYDAHWLLSKIYFQVDRFAEAAEHMGAAVELRPDDVNARKDLEMLRELARDQQ